MKSHEEYAEEILRDCMKINGDSMLPKRVTYKLVIYVIEKQIEELDKLRMPKKISLESYGQMIDVIERIKELQQAIEYLKTK